MKMNDVSDQIYNYLATKHVRVYRNKPIQSPVFPYVVFQIDTVLNTSPSTDMYLNINVFEDPNASVRTIETLADAIDTGLNTKVISTVSINCHFILEQRQWLGSGDLINAQMVNLRYTIRAYFK